jgi:DNA-binding CsgD family transcriptional regulator
MRLMPVAVERGASGWGLSLARDLISVIGRDDFVPRLLQLVREPLGADLMSSLAFENHLPVLLGHDTLAGRPAEARALRGYFSGCYREDPNTRMLSEELRPGDTMAVYMNKVDVPTLSYRRLCYEEPHIVDRLSLVHKTTRGDGITVNFYRSEPSGPFQAREFDAMRRLAPVLQAASVRHYELISVRRPTFEGVRARLEECFPMLTAREAECAAGAIVGLSAEGIAEKLGIRPTTVITHRQHAYRRLKVSGQRELVSLFNSRA